MKKIILLYLTFICLNVQSQTYSEYYYNPQGKKIEIEVSMNNFFIKTSIKITNKLSREVFKIEKEYSSLNGFYFYNVKSIKYIKNIKEYEVYIKNLYNLNYIHSVQPVVWKDNGTACSDFFYVKIANNTSILKYQKILQEYNCKVEKKSSHLIIGIKYLLLI